MHIHKLPIPRGHCRCHDLRTHTAQSPRHPFPRAQTNSSAFQRFKPADHWRFGYVTCVPLRRYPDVVQDATSCSLFIVQRGPRTLDLFLEYPLGATVLLGLPLPSGRRDGGPRNLFFVCISKGQDDDRLGAVGRRWVGVSCFAVECCSWECWG